MRYLRQVSFELLSSLGHPILSRRTVVPPSSQIEMGPFVESIGLLEFKGRAKVDLVTAPKRRLTEPAQVLPAIECDNGLLSHVRGFVHQVSVHHVLHNPWEEGCGDSS